MNHARGHDGSGVGSASHGIGSDECLEVDGLARGAGDAESLLKPLPVGCIREEKTGSFGALLLQSLQYENAASSIGQGQNRDGGIVLARAAREG